MAGIVGWGCYIPKYRIKTEDICKAHGHDTKSIIDNLGVLEKSVPGIDEDAATIAVEASRNALSMSGINPKLIGAIHLGSESHPYAVKPTGTIVGEALGIGNEYMCADFEFACKAGTAAIQVSLALVESGQINFALAGGCDTAQAAPGDMLEITAAAGGAVFIIGKDNVVAEVNHHVSFTSDTPDFWRRANQKYPSHGGAFTGDPAYHRHVLNATKLLFRKANTKPEDYDYVVFHQPNNKFPLKAAKALGFSREQIETGLLVNRVGNTYTGSSLLGLCAVLDNARPGQRILLTSYGSGAGSDSFDIIVNDEIADKQKQAKKVEGFMGNKMYIDYTTYLKNTGKL